MRVRALLLGAALSFIGGAAIADQEVIVGDLKACHLKIEYEAKEQMLHLRPFSPGKDLCEVPLSVIGEGLNQALKGGQDVGLIFLGRLIGYEGMSRLLMLRASKDARWDRATGKARDGHDNSLVAALLADPNEKDDALMVVREALAAQSYEITRVSVEKVLVLCVFDSKTVPSGCHPSDALVYLRIEKAP
jgi:hypothetical protein